MSQYTTDLAKAVAKKPDPTGQVRRSSATLLTWDAAELRGSVDWNGTIIEDVPILGALDAFSWVAGDEVVIDLVPGSNGGFASPMILGRVFRPRAANADKVLQGLQNSFAKEISAEIFAERISFAEDAAIVTATSTGFQDLGGPSVQVEISAIGRALVFLSCAISGRDTSAAGADASHGGRMSFEISGATTQAASTPRSVAARSQIRATGLVTENEIGYRMGTTAVVDGLNPGTHTFKTVYAQLFIATPTDFVDRTLAVIAF
jgi:hypothetical protein